jgi:hypothetical protein
MSYIVIFSRDPFLLARASMELQLEGIKSNKEWNDYYHPFNDNVKLTIGHPCDADEIYFRFWSIQLKKRGQINFTLTTRNYQSVVEKVFEIIKK